MKQNQSRRKQRGFTLLETMVAMGILSVGVLSLSAFYTQGLKNSSQVEIQYIANQKAQEALEAIFTARDTQELSYAQINNVSQGGIFLDGAQPLLAPGANGIVGTADDNANSPDGIVVAPGPDNVFGTADDIQIPLNPWMTRTIAISAVANETNLKLITVTINYNYVGQVGQVVLKSYISAYS